MVTFWPCREGCSAGRTQEQWSLPSPSEHTVYAQSSVRWKQGEDTGVVCLHLTPLLALGQAGLKQLSGAYRTSAHQKPLLETGRWMARCPCPKVSFFFIFLTGLCSQISPKSRM